MYNVVLVQTRKERKFKGVGIYGGNCKIAKKGNKTEESLQIKLA